MSTDVNVPPPPASAGPSAEELQLIRTQNELLRQQIDRNEQVFGELQKTIEFEARLRGPEEEQLAQAERERTITRGFQERTLKALGGELPIDPAFERQVEQDRTRFEEQFRQQLGPGYRTSSPFLEAQERFEANVMGLREGLRRAELTTGEAISRGREARLSDLLAQQFGQTASLANFNMGSIGAASGILGGVSGIQSRMLASQLELAKMQAALKGQAIQGIATGIGTATGLAVGMGFGGKK